jgi:CRP-like cAMP-binding protein
MTTTTLHTRNSTGISNAGVGQWASSEAFGLQPGRVRRYRKGDLLVQEGDVAESIILVKAGRVASRYQTLDGDQALVGQHGPGSFVASYAVAGTLTRHPASIVALEDTVVHLIRSADFKAWASEQPDVLWELTAALTDEVSRFGEQLTLAYWEKADVRVRRRVFEVAALAWRNGSGPTSVPLTHDDVAALAGVSRPTASTCIRAAVDAGVFRWRRGYLIVDDLATVRAWAL